MSVEERRITAVLSRVKDGNWAVNEVAGQMGWQPLGCRPSLWQCHVLRQARVLGST